MLRLKKVTFTQLTTTIKSSHVWSNVWNFNPSSWKRIQTTAECLGEVANVNRGMKWCLYKRWLDWVEPLSRDTSCEHHGGGIKVKIECNPHNTGTRGRQEMMWGGRLKKIERVLFVNEYLSSGSFVRGKGVLNAKSLHRLKEKTVQVQGRKIYE